jgi:hypothetical protein
MSALRGLFRTTVRFGAAAALCALTAACLGDPFSGTQIDASSPVAGEVARITRARTAYPSFRDIPAVSTDIRPLALYGRSAHELEVARAQVEADTAPGTWSLSDTESFAERARRQAGPELPAANPSQSEAEAQALRERATPPPRRR